MMDLFSTGQHRSDMSSKDRGEGLATGGWTTGGWRNGDAVGLAEWRNGAGGV